MRNRFFYCVLASVAFCCLMSAPAHAGRPFVGTFDVLIMVTDGSGMVNELSFFDCWTIKKKGAIRSAHAFGRIAHGRIVKQTPADGDTQAHAEYRAVFPDLGRVQGNITLDAFGGQVALGGTWRAKVNSEIRLVGSIAMVPARSGALCGEGTAP